MNARLTGVCIVSLSILSHIAQAGDWPHWRGANRDDISSEVSGFKNGRWKPVQKWKRELGIGGSSPVVVGNSVYCHSWRDGKDWLRCLNLQTGKTIWQQSYDSPQYGRLSRGDKGIYSGPSSTPEFDPNTGYIYTLGTDGDLRCWDTAKQGKLVWGLNLHEKLTIVVRKRIGRSAWRDYGFTTAPLIVGDWVLVEAGAKEGTVVAFDKRTGKRTWTSECKDQAGHTGGMSPIIVEGIPCVASLTLNNLVVVRTDKKRPGTTIAKFKWTTTFANNIATPAVKDNFVLITSNYNQQAICKLEITLKGARQAWKANYSSKVCSPVIVGGHVYFAWRQLRCLDWKTGKQLWAGGNFGDPGSCIATADHRLIVWGGRGRLVLAEMAKRSPKKYKEAAKIDRLSRTDVWPHVVLSNGWLLCRDRNGTLRTFNIH